MIPPLTGRRPPNDTKWVFPVLLPRLEGIVLANPKQSNDAEFLSSTKITEALRDAIYSTEFSVHH